MVTFVATTLETTQKWLGHSETSHRNDGKRPEHTVLIDVAETECLQARAVLQHAAAHNRTVRLAMVHALMALPCCHCFR